MTPDTDKIDEAVLALLYLTLHEADQFGGRAWKSHDWDALNRLHEKGFISDPKSKAKSVTLRPENIAAAEAAFNNFSPSRTRSVSEAP